MNCTLVEKPNSLINELKRQREFLLLDLKFAEAKLLNKKEHGSNNITTD